MQPLAVFFVGLGGAIGAICRYAISVMFSSTQSLFPWSTFIANLIGATLIGIGFVLLIDKPIVPIQYSEQLRSLFIVGFLGALTTYSSFSFEAVQLFSQGEHRLAFTYVAVTTVACLSATLVSIKLAQSVMS